MRETNQELCCTNKRCKLYGKSGSRNRIVKFGHDRNGRRRYRCQVCRKVFVETKGTFLYNRKKTIEQITLICKLLVEKNGIRAIERIMEIHRDTVMRIIEDLAAHCREITDFLIREVKLTKLQVDEMWTFIKKNKRNLPRKVVVELDAIIRGSTLG